jgi:phage tail protein X
VKEELDRPTEHLCRKVFNRLVSISELVYKASPEAGAVLQIVED